MKSKTVKRVFIVVICLCLLSVAVGCVGTGMSKSPAHRSGYTYYHTELVNADRALDEARAAGKDRACPAEFNALKDQVDNAYATYYACHTKEAIAMANDAIDKIKALCPASPRAEMKPAEKVVVERVAEKVIILEDVHFANDSITLTQEARTILRRNVQVLKQNPNMKIVIQGHTSAVASEEYNQKLSERRAHSVEKFLVEEGGIGSERLVEIGYGETRLEKAEPNPEVKESQAAQTNRRVIFKVIMK